MKKNLSNSASIANNKSENSIKYKYNYREVLLIIPQEGLLFEATGIAEIFDQANRCLEKLSKRNRYKVIIVTSEKSGIISGRSGIILHADDVLSQLDPLDFRDTIIITGGGATEEEREEISEWLSKAAPNCNRMLSACAGTMLLARAGLLNGRQATTHWIVSDIIREKYPSIKIQNDPIYIRDGKYWTSAGASAGFDLALTIVEADCGSEVAKEVAGLIVLYLIRPGSQSQFSEFLKNQPTCSKVMNELQSWIIEHLSQKLDVKRLADQVAMSPRNFSRVFVKEVGITPIQYVKLIRIEVAKQRLNKGSEKIETVASECGFGSVSALRRALKKFESGSPSMLRSKFGTK